jgi:hypothetical protein
MKHGIRRTSHVGTQTVSIILWQAMQLEEMSEEVATYFAKALDKTFEPSDDFKSNFFKDWHTVMTAEERNKIK